MQATLIYNGNSGGASKASVDNMQELLGEQGYSPVYKATSSEEDLDDALADVRGLVVAAGGDGTTRAVATRLLGRDAALALIPLGTANNIARTLGVEGSPETIIKGLSSPLQRPFDIGRVRSPFGESYFLEALGCGLFADVLYDYNPEQGKSVLRAFDTVKEVLFDYDPRHWTVKIDGEDMSGSYIGLEILNTKATGPRLELSPDASPSDGLLDVVCVCPPENVTLLHYLGGIISGTFDKLDNVDIVQARELEVSWNGSPFHVDAELLPKPGEERPELSGTGSICVDVLPGAIELWLPGG